MRSSAAVMPRNPHRASPNICRSAICRAKKSQSTRIPTASLTLPVEARRVASILTRAPTRSSAGRRGVHLGDDGEEHQVGAFLLTDGLVESVGLVGEVVGANRPGEEDKGDEGQGLEQSCGHREDLRLTTRGGAILAERGREGGG